MEKRLTADLNVVSNSNLEIQLLDGDLNIIQKLDDEPNDVGGLTSAELKAKFDESGNIIKRYINETLIPSVLTDDATEESRKQAEAARVTAEQGRVTAEEGRVSAETARAQAETARTSAETARGNAESQRANAETARVQNETERKTSEASRASAETARANAETQRAANETARQQAETERANAETQRQANETARQNAESSRNFWEDYDSTKSYAVGNKVAYGGSSYLCIKPCTGIAPPNAEYWRLIASRGADGAGSIYFRGTTLVIKSGTLPPSGDYETYSGDYSVKVPFGGDDAVLETGNKLMRDNLTVEAVNVAETTNPAGGKTMIIGE